MMTASAPLPHDPYITAVVDALTAAGLVPDECWTDDAEINRYDDGPNAGVTTQLDALLTWNDDHPAVDTEVLPNGLVLLWEHPAEQWLHSELQANGVLARDPDFVPGLSRWADPAAVVAAARELLAGRPAPTVPAALWEGASAAQASVDAWTARDGQSDG